MMASALNLTRISELGAFTLQIRSPARASIRRMISPHPVRTSLVIGAAGAALVTAFLVTQRAPEQLAAPLARGEIAMTARLATTRIPTGTQDQDVVVTITAP